MLTNSSSSLSAIRVLAQVWANEFGELAMFRQDKSTQMAASFLKLAGNRMPYIMMLKMMYEADRTLLVQRGVPITYDRWVSMRWGPVLSNTYDLIKANPLGPRDVYWSDFIRTDGYDVELIQDPGTGDLSPAEDGIIQSVFECHKDKDSWELVRYAHEFPEWKDPGGGATPITYSDVLRVHGFAPEDIDEILSGIEIQDDLSRLVRAK